VWNGLAHHIPCFAHVINLAVKAFLSNLKIAPLSAEHNWSNSTSVLSKSIQDDESESESEEDEDEEEEEDYNIIENNNLTSALQKCRAVSRAVNFPQGRILAFEGLCRVSDLKSLQPIRDHSIRWSATFNMLQRAVYLRKAIDLWTCSKSQYKKLILNEHEWEMIEFLVHFLHPFQIITTLVQGTSKPSLHDVWVKYEEMFDKLDEVKKAINEMTIRPIWLREVQVAIEKMWEKLGDYYSKTG